MSTVVVRDGVKVKIEISPADVGRIQAMLTCVMCGVVPDDQDKKNANRLYVIIEEAFNNRESSSSRAGNC